MNKQNSIICATSEEQYNALIEKWFWASIKIAEWRQEKLKYLYLYNPKSYFSEEDWGWTIYSKFTITKVFPIPEWAIDYWKCIIFVQSDTIEQKLDIVPKNPIQWRVYGNSTTLDRKRGNKKRLA
jgi:hypothetical protein